MTVEERIGAADRRKMDGNALFKEEKLEEAMQQYSMVTQFFSLIVSISHHFLLALDFVQILFLTIYSLCFLDIRP